MGDGDVENGHVENSAPGHRTEAVAALAEAIRNIGRQGETVAAGQHDAPVRKAVAGDAGEGAARGTGGDRGGSASVPASGAGAEVGAAAAAGVGMGSEAGAGVEPGPVTDRQRADALRAAAEVLSAGGAPSALAAAAVAEFGEGAAEALRADPWAVLALPGVRPEHADGFARGLLGPAAGPGDRRRAQALVPWLLEQAVLRGHSAVEIGEVVTGLEKLGLPDAAAALQEVVVDGRVMAFQDELPGSHHTTSDEDEPPTRTLLALERLALAEESLADGLVRIMSTFVPAEDKPLTEDEPETVSENTDADADEGPAVIEADAPSSADGPTADSDAPVEDSDAAQPQDVRTPSPRAVGPSAWESAATAASTSSATALIRAVAADPLVLHTGGEAARAEPAALLHAAHGLGLRVWAATWTDQGRDSLVALLPAAGSTDDSAGASPDDSGIAAAAHVVTLADLLSGTAGPGRAEDGSLALDVLIVLDAPLLDVELAATLLEALADGTRLVLSGDPGQLWSAGPGRFFADLLAAKACPAVASRTPDFGPIGELVSGIGIGELQSVEAPEKEVVIVTAKDGAEAVHRAIQLLTDSIPRALGIPVEQVVLLTPGHGGSAGTRALNAAAKARLNPGPGRFGGFDPGDRVAYSPVPGITHPARVVDGDASGLHLELSDGTRLTVTPAQAAKLRHGWALTVHQAVGRRWPGVVAVLPDDAAAGLTRQWVYTAFGRAERHLSVVHAAGQALPQAVAERPAQPRTTRLRAILAEQTGEA
ncbi:ATP-binding domain-containing protein [Saccharothrix sp. ST-888]|uniref:ATP-binding domain-containing protein n=1 Tax=Saccharothrix sp. ST-888 TaxID=1427391 RepID=UPI000696945A|nr:ATP-binding domain-containing protein [Saccharothrix sp. ST-888]